MRKENFWESGDSRGQSVKPQRAYREGYMAALDSLPHTDNPYPISSLQGVSWMGGWETGSAYVVRIRRAKNDL